MVVLLILIVVAGVGSHVQALAAPSPTVQAAGSIRIDAEARQPGPLYVRIGDAEKRIADKAVRAWLIEDGAYVVYSGLDGAGGYENEGQSLRLYDTKTGMTKLILSEYYVIDRVSSVRTATGKPALLVEMRDGGLGASHVAVVDPTRGEVFSQSKVKVMEVNSKTLLLGYFRERDWEALGRGENIRPYRTRRFDLDALLKRSVVVNKRRSA
jgi:hypothetical protein